MTQVYVHWAACFIITQLSNKEQGSIKLSTQGRSKLEVETGSNLARLLTICEMLLREHRLDQICLLLEFLDVMPYPESQSHYPARVRSLAKGMRKKRGEERALSDWHVERADRLIQDLRKAKDTGKDRWGWKAGVRVSVGDAYELHKMKKD